MLRAQENVDLHSVFELTNAPGQQKHILLHRLCVRDCSGHKKTVFYSVFEFAKVPLTPRRGQTFSQPIHSVVFSSQ